MLTQMKMTRPGVKHSIHEIGPALAQKVRALGVPKEQAPQVLNLAFAAFEPSRVGVEALDTVLDRAATTAVDIATSPTGTANVGGFVQRTSPFLALAGRLAGRYGWAAARWLAAAYATDQALDWAFGDDETAGRAEPDPNAPPPQLPDDPFAEAGGIPGGAPGPVGQVPAGYPGGGTPPFVPMPTPTPGTLDSTYGAGAGMQLAQVLYQMAPVIGALYREGDPDVRDAMRLLVAATLGGGRQPQDFDRCGYLAKAFARRDPDVTEAIAQYQCGVSYPIELKPRGKMAWFILEMFSAGLDFNDINATCGC